MYPEHRRKNTLDDKLWSMLEKYIDKTREYEDFKEITSIELSFKIDHLNKSIESKKRSCE